MKQILCIHLPRFQIDLHKRKHQRERSPDRQSRAKSNENTLLQSAPLVLVQSTAHRQLIVAVSADAPRTIRHGMTLAQARAHCSTLLAAEAPSEEQNNRALTALGRWFIRFSPNVSLAPPSSIFLDASGLERLFPDPHRWLQSIKQSLHQLRFDAKLALAHTPAAAWALAAFSDRLPRVHGSGFDSADAIALPSLHVAKTNEPQTQTSTPSLEANWFSLPPEALRLHADRCVKLHCLGLNTLGQLYRIPHNELTRRFPDVLLRLRQLTGQLPELLDWLTCQPPIREAIEFEFPIESLETIEIIIKQLIDPIVRTLTSRGKGARRLRLTLRRPYAASIEKIIELVRPSRRSSNLLNLIMRSLERLDAEVADRDGFIGFELQATMTERLEHEQTALEDEDHLRMNENRDHLIERLRARFGEVVQWLQPIESHLPERAFSCVREEPAVAAAVMPQMLPRPLKLLSTPRPVRVTLRPSSDHGRPISFTDEDQVHRLEHVNGPERIAGVWWNGSQNKTCKTRDYFDVQTTVGNRFWLFQVMETNTWYLHGLYD